MIELIDTIPQVDVQSAEYTRLLGFPRDRVLEGRSLELAQWARHWYAKHGRPWVYARQAEALALDNGFIRIDGQTFASKPLHKMLQQSEACGVVLVAVSAGPEAEREAARLWLEEKPDEYFFLEMFGSAVVEHLVATTGARLCGWSERQGMAVLPHYSPGYAEWDIAQQAQLIELLRSTRTSMSLGLPGPLEVLDSGMLRPRKSLSAVFGLTRQVEHVRKVTDQVPCENCSYMPCQYRRVPQRVAAERLSEGPAATSAGLALGASAASMKAEAPRVEASLSPYARYLTNAKALRRWVTERLSLHHRDDGTIDAHFRYEGTTCSNTGRALLFDYRVKLSSRDNGYVILEQHCGPAPGDEGYRFMCRYMTNAEHLMVAIDHDKPLLGQPLNDVLSWQRPLFAAACYCEPASRKHKWGMVLETIHFALAQHEARPETAAMELPTPKELTPQEVQVQ
ncbi:MAG: hypothetical protein ABIP55_04000 [Tepidisphaeraceae bacterium]